MRDKGGRGDAPASGEEHMDRRQIGKNIRTLRRRAGMTQERLAEAAGLSVPYISQMERGSKNARLEVLAQVAEALGVSLDVILSGIPPSERQAARTELQALLDDCTLQEQRVVLQVASAVKQTLRETDGEN